ncbi:MAG: glycosyltransferase [Candidatus Pacearchaeota archaeon]
MIPLALRSYNEQTFHLRELIIVHNDERPFKKEILTGIKGKIELIEINRRVKPGIARNLGIKIAQYDYIAKCDDDDWYYPKRLEVMFEIMERDKSLLATAYSLLSAYDVIKEKYGVVDKPSWYFDGSIMGRKKDLLEIIKKIETSGGPPCPFKWLKDNIFRKDLSKIGRIRDLTHLLILFHGENDCNNWDYVTYEDKKENLIKRFPSYVIESLKEISLKRKSF